MKIVCPSCGADYRMSEDKIPATGLLIRCPSCQHSFRAFSNGTTASANDSSVDVSESAAAPPRAPSMAPPPPPPLDVDDDMIEFDDDLDLLDMPERPGLLAPTRETAADYDAGPFGSADLSGSLPSSPVDEHAPPEPLTFGDSTSAAPPAVQVDDFDFSFGANDPLTENPKASGPLKDLFDDLDDLPAPKASQASIEIEGLPKPKDVIPDYSFDDLDDLPGLRYERDHTAATPSFETPGTDGLLAPDDSPAAPDDDIPDLPDLDDASPTRANPVQTSTQTKAPTPSGSGRSRGVLIALVLLLVLGGGGVATMMILEVGPFEPSAQKQVRKAQPKRKKRVAKKTRKNPVQKPKSTTETTRKAVSATDNTNPKGFVPTSGATMAEVAGYRDAIAELESQVDTLDQAGRSKLTKLYAFGALDYPENIQWVRAAEKLTEKFDENAKGVDTQVALLAAQLAARDKSAAEAIEKLAKKKPRSGELQSLLGYARLQQKQIEPAFNAFRRAYRADASLLAAQRRAGELALNLGRVKEAAQTMEALYRKAPGAPTVNTALAAIESHRGKVQRAEKLLTQTLTLKSGRARPQDRSQAFVLRARIALKRGDKKSAKADLNSAVRAWSGNSEALGLLSEAHIKEKRFDEAINQLRGLERAGAKSAATSMKIAQCYAAMGRMDRSLEVLLEARDAYPKDAMVLIELGSAYERKKEFKQAYETYRKAAKLDKDSGLARLRIAQLMVKEAKIDPALKYLVDAAKSNPRDALMQIGLGDIRVKMAQTMAQGYGSLYDQAETHYRQALALDASSVQARRGLVTALIENGKPNAALTAISQLGQRTDFYGKLDYESARAHQLLGRYKRALSLYQEALKSEPNNIEYMKYMGITYFSSGQLEKAKTLLSKVLMVDPKNGQGHYHMGLIDFRSGQYEQAIQSFQKVLEREKQNQRARYWKARALEAAGAAKQLKAAKSEYEAVSRFIQKTPDLVKELCDVYWRLGVMKEKTYAEWNEADTALSRYLECSPKNAAAWFMRGQLRAKLGQLSSAVKDYERAVKLKPRMGKAYAENAFTRMRNSPYNEKFVQSLLQRATRYDKTLARPHYVLCNMVKERNKAQARRHCQQYLKLAPKGDNASEARLLLRSL